jgi:hypothetical protein
MQDGARSSSNALGLVSSLSPTVHPDRQSFLHGGHDCQFLQH